MGGYLALVLSVLIMGLQCLAFCDLCMGMMECLAIWWIIYALLSEMLDSVIDSLLAYNAFHGCLIYCHDLIV
jgi:hypothetical protein